MTSRITTFVLAIATSGIPNATHGESDPQWIGPARDGIDNVDLTTYELEKQFVVDQGIEAATLRVAADFCDVEVVLNGHRIAKVSPYDFCSPISVTRWCRKGNNSCKLIVHSWGIPVAAAVDLRVQDGEGGIKVLSTDNSWSLSENGDQQPTTEYGAISSEPWWHVQERPTTNAFDEYNQWKDAATEVGVNSAKLIVPPDFSVEAIYQVPKQYGSWISMTLDDRGRLLVGKEKSGVLRVTLQSNASPKIEEINTHLQGCHGILWTPQGLFVNASDSRALYRLRDTNQDDEFDELQRLREIPGGRGDHGRNDLTVGPDGAIYSIHGDAVDLPDGHSNRVPITRELAGFGTPTGGHLIKTDFDGSTWEVIAAGLRNPYGLAFNRDGEVFTYDADSERHVGLPWYRPTRMNHLVSGTDYGWRNRQSLPWPTYLPDILPPNVLIGRGSPTCIRFGYRSHFPTAYREALFAPDWSFGRVFAVHVVPRGASYSMHPETFLRGRPFNICDIEFAGDGSMYLLTGGHGTRSVLYKLEYNGTDSAVQQPTAQVRDRQVYSEKMRGLRRQLESVQTRRSKDAIRLCWEFLNHPDRWIRHAARIGLERQPPATWMQHAYLEPDVEKLLPALLALVRVSPEVDAERIWAQITRADLATQDQELQSTAVRIAWWLTEYHALGKAGRIPMEVFERLYPTGSSAVDRELCSLLVMHGSLRVVSKTLDLLDRDPPQIEALHYLMELAKCEHGWTKKDRQAYFRLVAGARLYRGDEGLPKIIQQIQSDALANVPMEERNNYSKILSPPSVARADAGINTKRPIVKHWRVADFDDELFLNPNASARLGQDVFAAAKCSQCHRVGALGRSFGPDLTGIAGRYRPREILESILHPSKVVSSRFTNHTVVTSDGKVVTGQIVWDGFRKSVIRMAVDPFRMDQTIEISKYDIESTQTSTLSPMPEGLLDTFTKDDIENLLAYIVKGINTEN